LPWCDSFPNQLHGAAYSIFAHAERKGPEAEIKNPLSDKASRDVPCNWTAAAMRRRAHKNIDFKGKFSAPHRHGAQGEGVKSCAP
jgi:hypothetical protein